MRQRPRMLRYGEIKRLTWRGRVSLRWYVRVYRPDGTRTWLCTRHSDEELARAQVRVWSIAAITQGSRLPAPPLAEVLCAWSKAATVGRSEPYRRCVMVSRQRIAGAFGARTIDGITTDDIGAWIARRLERGDAPRTINLDAKILRATCSWAIEHGYIERNPVTRRLHIPVPQAEPRVLSAIEESRLLDAAHAIGDLQYGYVLCMLATGFRSGLVGMLRWEYADLHDGLWHIPAARMKSRRPYCQPIAPRLMEWLCTHAQPEGYIFGGRSIHWWYHIRDRAGMPTLRRHDLRRTFITRCRQAGIDIETCMDLSDHRDLRTMLSVYRRVGLDESRRALERLEAQRSDRCD